MGGQTGRGRFQSTVPQFDCMLRHVPGDGFPNGPFGHRSPVDRAAAEVRAERRTWFSLLFLTRRSHFGSGWNALRGALEAGGP